MPERASSETHCLLTTVSNLLGGKWKLQVLAHLMQKSRRFGELRRLMPECSEKMLISTLRDLEADGLLVRTIYHEVPPRVDYALSDKGASLTPALRALMVWGKEYLHACHPGAGIFVHEDLIEELGR